MPNDDLRLTYREIFTFWVPLAATWIMMGVELPFLAAIVARLAEPKYNLAAFGVAYSFALIIEAPIIMIMSASTALVGNKDSFVKMRNFTYTLNGLITIFMLIGLLPPVFYSITQDLIGLPEKIARLTHIASIILLPWPSAIGYRRFYQGILIRHNLTRRVAYGTVVRLASMASTAIILCSFFRVDGAVLGAAALSAGVTLEALASRLMARMSVKRLLLDSEASPAKKEYLTYRFITKFYYPLALTSILALAAYPMVTFFIGRSRLAIESLAVLPVVAALVFIFRGLGLSYQEVVIALMGDTKEDFVALRNFAAMLGLGVIASFSLITFTPLGTFWFHHISGLSKELTSLAITPARLMAVIPGLAVLLSFQRSLLVISRKTTPITVATGIEVGSIAAVLFLTIKYLDAVGAVAAALAFVLGRLAANIYLLYPYVQVVRQRT